ncbi:MAG: hypothetical protein FIB05_06285 [Betaproteobacteria bacterium]|nr:hypothetical protein [Betaproteobacteria bacterium]
MSYLGIMIGYPWMAWVVAAGLAALWRASRSKAAAVAAVAWAGYGVYEYLMYARILCTGECNIRVDLLLFYPLLLALAVLAVVQGLRARGARRRPD